MILFWIFANKNIPPHFTSTWFDLQLICCIPVGITNSKIGVKKKNKRSFEREEIFQHFIVIKFVFAFFTMLRIYRANRGGIVANVRYPVWPGIVYGACVVTYFFCSFVVFKSLASTSSGFCESKTENSQFEYYSVWMWCNKSNEITFVFKNSKSKTFIIFVLTYSSTCRTSMDWISTKPFCSNASQHRCTCSMHGENEQKRPPKNWNLKMYYLRRLLLT